MLTSITAVIASSDKTTISELLVITDTLETATANKDVLTLNARVKLLAMCVLFTVVCLFVYLVNVIFLNTVEIA